MKRTFIVTIETEEDDFTKIDLKEAIEDGLQNVGNYEPISIEIEDK